MGVSFNPRGSALMAKKTAVVSDISGQDADEGYTVRVSTPDGNFVLDVTKAEADDLTKLGRKVGGRPRKDDAAPATSEPAGSQSTPAKGEAAKAA